MIIFEGKGMGKANLLFIIFYFAWNKTSPLIFMLESMWQFFSQ